MRPIQYILIICVFALLRISRNRLTPYTKATARLGLSLLTLVLIFSVLFPELTNIAANWLGIGRGADLILYFTAIGLIALSLLLLLKLRSLDQQLTKIVRQIALLDRTDSD